MNIPNPSVAIKALMTHNSDVTTMLKEIDRISEALNSTNTAGLLNKFGDTYKENYLNPETKKLFKVIVGNSKVLKPSEVFKQLADTCDIAVRELTSMRSLVNNDAIEFILKENLEMKQGYIIHFLACCEFMDRYIRSMLIVVTELESAAFNNRPVERNTLTYLDMVMEAQRVRCFTDFVDYLLSRKKEKIIEDLYKMPALDIDDSVIRAVTSTGGPTAVDPAGLSVTGSIGSLLNLINPVAWIYATNKAWSEFLFWRLEENEAEINYLERRHQELVEQQERGGTTVATAKSIERYKERITVVRATIKRIRSKL